MTKQVNICSFSATVLMISLQCIGAHQSAGTWKYSVARFALILSYFGVVMFFEHFECFGAQFILRDVWCQSRQLLMPLSHYGAHIWILSFVGTFKVLQITILLSFHIWCM